MVPVCVHSPKQTKPLHTHTLTHTGQQPHIAVLPTSWSSTSDVCKWWQEAGILHICLLIQHFLVTVIVELLKKPELKSGGHAVGSAAASTVFFPLSQCAHMHVWGRWISTGCGVTQMRFSPAPSTPSRTRTRNHARIQCQGWARRGPQQTSIAFILIAACSKKKRKMLKWKAMERKLDWTKRAALALIPLSCGCAFYFLFWA